MLQAEFGTTARAAAFYSNQMLDRLNDGMQSFASRMDLVFISTADAHGDCNASFRAGRTGFVQVLNDHTLAYPEFRGNGVMASLGNMLENRQVGLLFLDFYRDKIGLHVNGRASVITPDQYQARRYSPRTPAAHNSLRDPCVEFWVVIDVEEAYSHWSKHIPLLRKLTTRESVAWGTDDAIAKDGDYFKAAAGRRPEETGVRPPPQHQPADCRVDERLAGGAAPARSLD